MFCQKCGADNAENTKFCSTCGQPMLEGDVTKATGSITGFVDVPTLKNASKKMFDAKVGDYIIVSFIVMALLGVSSSIPVIGPVVSFLCSFVLLIGLIRAMKHIRDAGHLDFNYLATGFKDNFGNIFVVGLVKYLLVSIGMVLCLLPGFYLNYRYYFVENIIDENPDMAIGDVMNRCEQMTQGKKMDLFFFDLSFIGWWLLCLVTCGLASIYVWPMYMLTRINLYEAWKK